MREGAWFAAGVLAVLALAAAVAFVLWGLAAVSSLWPG